jgi:hypothetical protein
MTATCQFVGTEAMDPTVKRIAEALERIAAAFERQAEVDSLPKDPEKAAKELAKRRGAQFIAVVGLLPEALDKNAAAAFLGVEPEAIEHLIRIRKLAYVQTGSQRGRVIPVEALREFLKEYRQEALRLPERNGR